jgi:hypothetical protein
MISKPTGYVQQNTGIWMKRKRWPTVIKAKCSAVHFTCDLWLIEDIFTVLSLEVSIQEQPPHFHKLVIKQRNAQTQTKAKKSFKIHKIISWIHLLKVNKNLSLRWNDAGWRMTEHNLAFNKNNTKLSSHHQFICHPLTNICISWLHSVACTFPVYSSSIFV